MRPGDLVLSRGSYYGYFLLDKPSRHASDDPGMTGRIAHRELCIVLEARDGWLRVMGSHTSAIGWVEDDLMDPVGP